MSRYKNEFSYRPRESVVSKDNDDNYASSALKPEGRRALGPIKGKGKDMSLPVASVPNRARSDSYDALVASGAFDDFIEVSSKKSKKTASSARSTTEPMRIRVDKLATQLPKSFTVLNIVAPSRSANTTPPRMVNTAKTAPARLLHNLYQSKLLYQDDNLATGQIKGNLACGQLSIISRDGTAEDLYLNISNSNEGGSSRTILTPYDLYGNSEYTFSSFSKYHLDYLDGSLLKDPVVKRVLGKQEACFSNSDLKQAGHDIRSETHHSEQFFIAAIYKTLLAIKGAGKEFSNSTFILDIATDLAPCDHCIKRIDDFFNHLRENLFPEDNYFVARITWNRMYSKGDSPSKISERQERREAFSSDDIEISDFNRNYILTCRANDQIAARSNPADTRSGMAAGKSGAILSRNNSEINSDKVSANIGMWFKGGQAVDSPPKSKRSNLNHAKISRLKQDLIAKLRTEFPDDYDPTRLMIPPPPRISRSGSTSLLYDDFEACLDLAAKDSKADEAAVRVSPPFGRKAKKPVAKSEEAVLIKSRTLWSAIVNGAEDVLDSNIVASSSEVSHLSKKLVSKSASEESGDRLSKISNKGNSVAKGRKAKKIVSEKVEVGSLTSTERLSILRSPVASSQGHNYGAEALYSVKSVRKSYVSALQSSVEVERNDGEEYRAMEIELLNSVDRLSTKKSSGDGSKAAGKSKDDRHETEIPDLESVRRSYVSVLKAVNGSQSNDKNHGSSL